MKRSIPISFTNVKQPYLHKNLCLTSPKNNYSFLRYGNPLITPLFDRPTATTTSTKNSIYRRTSLSSFTTKSTMSTVAQGSSSSISSTNIPVQPVTIPFPSINHSSPLLSSSSSSSPPSTSSSTLFYPHIRMVVAGTFDILHEGHYLLFHTAFAFGQHVEIWISDDAMRIAKAQKTGQFLQPYDIRKQNVEKWCNQQTMKDYDEFYKKYRTVSFYSSSSSVSNTKIINNGMISSSSHSSSSHSSSSLSIHANTTLDSSSNNSSRPNSISNNTEILSSSSSPSSSPYIYHGRYSVHELQDAYGPSITDPTYTAITCSEETKEGCFSINRYRNDKRMVPLDIYCTPLAINDKGEKLSSTTLRAAKQQSKE